MRRLAGGYMPVRLRKRAAQSLQSFRAPAKAAACSFVRVGRRHLGNFVALVVAAFIFITGSNAAFAQAPTVTSISPNVGTVAGGTSVTITGTNFVLGLTTVTIGGQPATNVIVDPLSFGTVLTATTPAGGTPPAPTVTAISPNHGPTSGGTFVTITGTNFGAAANVVVTTPNGNSGGSGNGLYTYAGATGVTIGGTAASNVTVVSATQITANAPAGIPGVGDVIVTTTGGNSGTSGQELYTYTNGGPSVTAIGPTFGLTTGGTAVSITGANFVPGTGPTGVPATSVTIGGHAATNVVVGSTVSLTATVPAGSAGAADVVVTTAAGSGDGGFIYLYVAPATPTVAAIAPTSGTIAGGTSVTITGANFTGATSVTIGGNAALGVQVTAPGTITATTPPGSAGAVNVVVTTPGGTGTGTGLFTYVTPPPTVTSIAPNVGTTAGGTSVTITGSNFTGTTAVTIGGTAVPSFTVNGSGTSITTTTPPGSAGAANVAVTTPSGTGTGTGLYTYGTPPPTVTAISPNTGPAAGGTAVTITGSNFTGATSVTIGGAAVASFTVNGAGTSITTTTPAGTAGSTVNVVVTTPAGPGTGAGLFTYATVPPTVTAISPPSGTTLGGTAVTITGTNFTGTPTVTIGGTAAASVIVVSSTSITAKTPAGTGTNVPVIVTTTAGPSLAADLYSYVTTVPPAPPAPTVTAISPPSGTTAGGTPVTITGANFTGATSVTIGGNTATNVTVVSATSITATTPPGALGAADVAVTTPGGTGTGPGLYTYVTVAPTVTAISPNTGTTQGGTPVTITGTNFTGATAVTIGGTAATSFTVFNATTITASTPAHAAGAVNVVVTTPAGSGTGTNLYTYVAQAVPTVTAISPNNGTTAGGTSVTITGTNFTGATAVTIGGTAATFVTLVSATSITATTPAHAAGAANVVVTTPAGTGTGTNLYTYVTPVPPPTVTAISPNSGSPGGGSSVTITGTNLGGATAVKFGIAPATSFTVNSATSITATSPAGAGTVDVTVTTPGGTSATSATDQFSYVGTPTVVSVSPNAGLTTGGTGVTITGTNFTGVIAVKFGGTSATSFTVNSAISIVATTPAGTGTVDVTVTTSSGTSATSSADHFAYGKATTMLTLTSSPNPSAVGQLVTITARVTGNSPTGTVIFSDNGKQIDSATLSGGIATFATASLPVGSNSITASYGGDANNAPDPVTLIQIVGAPTDSVNLREMQISAMPIVANIAGQNITAAIDNAIGVGFSGIPPGMTPNGSGFIYYFGGEQQTQRSPTSDQESRVSSIDNDFAALGYAPQSAAPPTAPTLLAADLPAAPPTAAPRSLPRDWLAWIDVRGTDFDRTTVGSDLKGVQIDAVAGLTRRLTADFLVGVLAGFEHFDFSSQAYNGVLTGYGLTTGTYLGWRLTPSLRFEAAAAWSDIFAADTSGTASGNFTGQRWLTFGGLTGSFGWWGWEIQPSAQVYALWERENAYTDSLGTLQANHEFDTGRSSGGVKLIYPITSGAVKFLRRMRDSMATITSRWTTRRLSG